MASLHRIARHMMHNKLLTYCVVRHLKHCNVSLPKPLLPWTNIHHLCLCTDASTDVTNRGRHTSKNSLRTSVKDSTNVAMFMNKNLTGHIDEGSEYSRHQKNVRSVRKFRSKDGSVGKDREESFRTSNESSCPGKGYDIYRKRAEVLMPGQHPKSSVSNIADDKTYQYTEGNDLEVFKRRKFYEQDFETAGWRKERSHDVNSASDNVDESYMFGSLSEDTTEQPFIDEDEEFQSNDADEDSRPHLRLSKYNRRNPPYWYENKIRALGREGKVAECIEVFEEWMLENDRVLPTSTCVSTYLGVLGRAGYTKKAFQIFNRMKKMKGVKLKEPSYTALFNACANSPWKEDGLKRARHLRGLMLSQDIQANETTTKAMIKAFGTLGDLPTAFILADEASSRRINMDPEFFSFMLMAAISDKEAGFRYGLEVWKKMVQWRIKLDLYHYNLLVRLISECGIGNPDELHLLLTPTITESSNEKTRVLLRCPICHLPFHADCVLFELEPILTGEDTTSSTYCNYCAEGNGKPKEPKHKNTDDGAKGREETYALHNTKYGEDADIKSTGKQRNIKSLPESKKGIENLSGVVTDVVPADEHETIVSVVETKIPDILNPLETFSKVVSFGEIKTAQDRFALIGGLKGFFERMKKDHVYPDILTFTQLLKVIGNSTEDEEILMDLMTSCKVKPDVLFFNSLIHKRCMRKDREAARAVVPLMTEHKVVPDMKTYAGLALTCSKRAHGMQLLREIQDAGMIPNSIVFGSLLYVSTFNLNYKKEILTCMKDLGVSPTRRSLQFIEKHLKYMEANGGNETALRNFKLFYDNWLKSVMVEEIEHPWKSFVPRKSNREPDKDRFKTKLEEEQRISRRMRLKSIPMKER